MNNTWKRAPRRPHRRQALRPEHRYEPGYQRAIIHLFIGFGLALINVIVCYFLPRAPRVISITRWGIRPRVLIVAYLIALVFQIATAPLFRSYLTSAYTELAWSPFQAVFNVLGILLIDM